MLFLRMFQRKWWLTTLLVIVAVGVMIRLGIWQLDRLETRRAFNARVQAQIDQAPLVLDATALDADVANMEYRQVVVTGAYDHSQEIALRNQALEGRWGVHLVTPLRIQGSDTWILVDRGWVPGDVYETGDWTTFAEPGVVTVQGVLRASKDRPDFGRRTDPTPVPGGPRLETWNFINVAAIQQQVPYSLLPAYVQQAPDPAWTGEPVRTQPHLELTEGSHMGYALQWFLFASILGLGYPFFIRSQEKERAEQAAQGIVPVVGEEK